MNWQCHSQPRYHHIIGRWPPATNQPGFGHEPLRDRCEVVLIGPFFSGKGRESISEKLQIIKRYYVKITLIFGNRLNRYIFNPHIHLVNKPVLSFINNHPFLVPAGHQRTHTSLRRAATSSSSRVR